MTRGHELAGPGNGVPLGHQGWLRQQVVAALLKGYRALNEAGVLDGPVARRLFTYTYFTGKRYLENNLAPFLARYPSVVSGGHVLDIGANIGYTAVILARALTPGFKVIAFGPEPKNVATLRASLALYGVQDRVQVEAAAVGDTDRTVELWYNAGHHADHRILTPAFGATRAPQSLSYRVPQVSIDSFVEQAAISPIRFIKMMCRATSTPCFKASKSSTLTHR